MSKMKAVNTEISAKREMVFDFYKKKIKYSLKDKYFPKNVELQKNNIT